MRKYNVINCVDKNLYFIEMSNFLVEKILLSIVGWLLENMII